MKGDYFNLFLSIQRMEPRDRKKRGTFTAGVREQIDCNKSVCIIKTLGSQIRYPSIRFPAYERALGEFDWKGGA